MPQHHCCRRPVSLIDAPILVVVARWLLQDVLERRRQSNLPLVKVALKHRGLVLDPRVVVNYDAQAMAPDKLRQLG